MWMLACVDLKKILAPLLEQFLLKCFTVLVEFISVLKCFCLFDAVQRNKLRLRSFVKPREEGALRPLWRAGLTGRRRGRSWHGRHLLPHFWWQSLRLHGWTRKPLQKRRAATRRGHGPPTEVSPRVWTRLTASSEFSKCLTFAPQGFIGGPLQRKNNQTPA